MKKYKVGLVLEKMLAESLFSAGDMSFLASIADVNPIQALPETVSREYMMETLEGADVAITCWRTPAFTEEMLQSLPRLRLIAHAAGSVKNLVPPSFWTSGRRITSNAPVIAEDVAQTTLALILTSLKQLWQLNASTAAGEWKGGESGAFTTRRLDGLSVGIVGASLVGREVLRILQPFHCRLLLADPYLSPLEAENLGAELLPLEDLIRQSDVLTLHAPANEDCRHMLNAQNLPLLRDGALLVNTARGMLIDEAALLRELRTGRIMACLDVTDPEPPAPDSPLRTLPNVVLTPHIAGGHTQNGRRMMGRNILIETYNFLVKGALKFEVRGDMLQHMA